MNKQELETRLEEIEQALWDLKMNDRWTQADYIKNHKLECERIDIKRKLREVSE